MSTNRWINPVNNNLLRDAEGNLLPGGTLEIYAAGTSTPLAVYSDTSQAVSLGSVLTADAYGLLPDFHLTNGTQFKAIAKNSSGATKWTRDYLYTADSANDSRLDALEASVAAMTGLTYNGIVNGGMRVALNNVLTLTSTFTEGKVNRLFGRVTNVTAGTLTQGSDTGYASAKYGHFSGVSMSSSGVVEAQIRIPSGEAGRFANDGCVFSCLVRQDTGSSVNYTVTIKKPSGSADDFSSLTTISTSSTTAAATGTDTRLEFAVADMGDCSKGIAIEVSASIGASITTKNFRITEAQLEVGGARSAFVEGDFDMSQVALTDVATKDYVASQISAEGVVVGRDYTSYATYARITTAAFLDDTEPLATEGDDVMTITRSALADTNRYRHTVTIVGTCFQTSVTIVSVWQGSTLIYAAPMHGVGGYEDRGARTITFENVPGTTASTTFTVQVGVVNPGWFDINGYSGARVMGGKTACTYVIEEIQP